MSQRQYSHLSFREREDIRYYRIKHKRSLNDVAELIERHRSTIYRELARNRKAVGRYGAASTRRSAALPNNNRAPIAHNRIHPILAWLLYVLRLNIISKSSNYPNIQSRSDPVLIPHQRLEINSRPFES